MYFGCCNWAGFVCWYILDVVVTIKENKCLGSPLNSFTLEIILLLILSKFSLTFQGILFWLCLNQHLVCPFLLIVILI